MVQRNNHNNSNNKGKGKAFNNAGPKNTTTFKKKKKGGNKDKDPCFVCGGLGHWASNCKERKGGQIRQKFANLTIGNNEDAGHQLLSDDGERRPCFCSWCWHGGSEVYFGKDRAAEERAACALHSEESCWWIPPLQGRI
ncbi:uncharacterized protein LOC112270004 isoform X1 [Brachypodium distachyon]|uniref:uncharacterized protein LOC112270004 isoform X1 n=1 Tax=Brachypodium distachyon TaxID=15368 RepID=UPI000D0D2EB2|nr:uncharacterized protein LOC112270004 isoform X1 [Brachypodium distachyon]|eukprot:XP_024313373.1 uncharacterized protein LOC112270004 isoform X1 [Brachypodium distachyon]